MAKAWKRTWRVSWNACGMCFSITPGTPSGPAALWFGVRRRASWKMAGVICPISIGTEGVGVGWTWPSQGNGAPGGNVGSGERGAVSIIVSCVNTYDGVVRRLTDFSSLKMCCRVVGCPLRGAED